MLFAIFEGLGGLALFLLAMGMMSEGLRDLAGDRLRSLLGRWTSTPLRGVGAGALLTAVVQSSSAVTVATLGFVNAGLLGLPQALGVVFGTNVGTTMTGWLVSLTGLDLRVEGLALPLIAIGMAARLLANRDTLRGLGTALVGFGLFFLGLSFLKASFGGLGGGINLAAFGGGDLLGVLAMLAIGFFVTMATQSSSAAIALVITAASQGLLSLPAAAAAVIGTNLGTTSTAAFAVIGATSSAKRVAAGHIAFNLITGAVALLILPILIWIVRGAGTAIGLGAGPAATLALFHTLFNVLGVLLLLPQIDRLAARLERMFRTAEEDIARPRHLDRTLAATPELALAALDRELDRQRLLAGTLAGAALSGESEGAATTARAIRRLGEAIAGYAVGIGASSSSAAIGKRIAAAMRIARYLEETARLAPRANALRRRAEAFGPLDTGSALGAAIAAALEVMELAGEESLPDPESLEARMATFDDRYNRAKASLLEAGAARAIGIDALEALLDDLSHTRRMVEQFVKAVGHLATREAVPDAAQESDRHETGTV